ncbi:Ferritin-like domain-containing protein [Flavobacteriaceae bacterium MAR_2010_188]|nr:Ferritin-like domain-containing protein [Flavobacteriaceae bacterium MAR_2010_188]
MNIIKFLDEFTNEGLLEKTTSRRGLMNSLGSFSKRAALAAVPFGLAGASSKLYAQSANGDPIAALQLALTLEYLEAEFYNMGTVSGGIVETQGSAAEQTTFRQIAKHENQHVAFLQGALGADSIDSPMFDFTVGGAFDPFNEDSNVPAETSYAQFLALAQAFEDTGVRAYKGQAGNLMGNDALLTAGLQIHSVEARHASQVRRIRGLKGWITRNERGAGMPEATQDVYNGEENIMQGGLDVTSLGSGSPFTVDASTQAYDEILTGDEAVDIASLFITS